MYIIDDTYFQAPKRDVPNLNEPDSREFDELNLLIDEECRLFMQSILTDSEIEDFDSYLVDGMFPTNVSGVPDKWVNLVNGYSDWKGLIFTLGTYKGSLLADLVYYNYLVDNVSYMTGVGDVKGNPKGASQVIATQRIVNTWNNFVTAYCQLYDFLKANPVDYEKTDIYMFEFKNQLGI